MTLKPSQDPAYAEALDQFDVRGYITYLDRNPNGWRLRWCKDGYEALADGWTLAEIGRKALAWLEARA